MRAFLLLLLTLCATLCAAAPVAGGVQGGAPEGPRRSAEEMRVLRERWNRLSPEEQRRLRERYEHYRRLGEGERRQLHERAGKVRELAKEVERDLGSEVRESLERLRPERRREVLNDMVGDEVGRRFERMRDKMSKSWRERLEGATPDERRRTLQEFKSVQRERVSRHAVGELGRHLGRAEDEVRRMEELPPEERARKVLELQQELIERDIRTDGLPAGMDARQWERMQSMPPEKFFHAVMRLRDRQIDAMDPADAPSDQRERRHRMQRLRESLKLSPELQVQFGHLPRAERRAALDRELRSRGLAAVRELELLPPERLRELEGLSDRRVVERLQQLLREERRQVHEDLERRGDGRFPGRGWRGGGRGGRDGPRGRERSRELDERQGGSEPRGDGDAAGGGGKDREKSWGGALTPHRRRPIPSERRPRRD